MIELVTQNSHRKSDEEIFQEPRIIQQTIWS